jgi:hypothetical protein
LSARPIQSDQSLQIDLQNKSRATRDNKSGTIANLPTSHTSFRAPTFEKWRPTVDSAKRTRREPTEMGERNVLQADRLQLSALGSKPGEMAPLGRENASFSAVFRPFVDDFPRVFWRARACGRKLAQMRHRKALLLNQAQTSSRLRDRDCHGSVASEASRLPECS